jgi:hypothetical protein
MNALEIFIILNEMDHIETLNKLTQAGLISDLAVVAADVWSGDAEKARDWLAEQE